MPNAPLFNSSFSELKAGLRLSGSTQPDTIAILDRALSEVRVGLYSQLGETRITEILATSLVPSPVTTAQLDRTKAALTETLWVKYLLLLELPLLFMDSSGQTDQVWNEEGLVRDSTPRRVEQMRESLWSRITSLLNELNTRKPNGGPYAVSLSPVCDPLRPGDSIRGRGDRLF